MSLRFDNPYRLWVYSLKGAMIDAAMLTSIPADQWQVCGYGDAIRFMEYAGWPLVTYDRPLRLHRTCATNPHERWHASWMRDDIMRDYADGPDAVTCLSRLWLLAVENISREARSKDWDHHLRSFMRHVACPTPSPDNLTPAKP